jgi:hypothetical protein
MKRKQGEGERCGEAIGAPAAQRVDVVSVTIGSRWGQALTALSRLLLDFSDYKLGLA